MTTRTLSRRKRLLFALVATGSVILVAMVALLAVDVYLHGRFQKSGSVNIWGYRGPVLGRKKPGDLRIAFLGGSTAFGYGVNWDEAIPAQLEDRLNARLPPGVSHVSVANLGFNNEGAFSFVFTLDDYRYLDYDIVCLYEGYNDTMGDRTAPNTSVFRRDSTIFKLTGYMPIFPVVFREKSSALRYGGDVGAMYRAIRGEEIKTVFRPGLADRTAAGALDASAAIAESLERQVARAMHEPRRQIVGGEATGCRSPWGEYCKSMFTAVDRVLALEKRVLVISQPYLAGYMRARHIDQQTTMVAELMRRYQNNPHVQYINVGDAVDITNPLVGYDSMHLTAAASAIVAEHLVGPVLALAQVK